MRTVKMRSASMYGYSLIELLLVLSISAVATLKGYQALERRLEQHALDRTVAVMRTLAYRARAFQREHPQAQWPDSPMVLAQHFGMANVLHVRNGFGAQFDFSASETATEGLSTLRISTQLPHSHQARYIASQLGYSATHNDNRVDWAHLPDLKNTGLSGNLRTLDADIDLLGHRISGLSSINSKRRGEYDLRLSVLKVDRLIVRSLAAQWLSWVDQPDGRPLYHRRYPRGWPRVHIRYVAPRFRRPPVIIGPPIFYPT